MRQGGVMLFALLSLAASPTLPRFAREGVTALVQDASSVTTMLWSAPSLVLKCRLSLTRPDDMPGKNSAIQDVRVLKIVKFAAYRSGYARRVCTRVRRAACEIRTKDGC